VTPALGLLVLAVVFVVVEVALHASHGLPPGTWAVFGIIGCALLIVGSKSLGKAGLQRAEAPERE
jgi:membrane-bound ClpP family serine protease